MRHATRAKYCLNTMKAKKLLFKYHESQILFEYHENQLFEYHESHYHIMEDMKNQETRKTMTD